MDSEDEFESPSYQGVPASIVLINVFDYASTNTAQIAHAATCNMVRQYLRQSTSQCISVCIFGTEETDDVSKLDATSFVEVFHLAPPTLDDFKKLQNFNILYPKKQAKELIMSDVLHHCSKMFKNCNKLLTTRTITILSRLDTPPMINDQKPTLKRVEDLVDLNVEIRIINVAETGYQIHEFYNDFLLEANKGKDVILPTHVWCKKEIEKLLHQHAHRHLAVAKLSFEIGNGLNIGVGVYSLMKSQGQTRHKTSNLDRETNAVITSVTKLLKVSADTGNEMDVDEQPPNQVLLHKSELLYTQIYGGERVEFTATEMKAINNPFGPPMLKLLGFKPTSLMCKEKWYLKKSYFLFPNDGLIEGSIVAFKALHQACVETGMVAICVMCTRVNSRLINVALAPCTNPLGLDIDVGFDVICIPFVENVRDIPNTNDDEEVKINNVEKNLMKETIESIKFSYKPEMFENPKLQSEYKAIEAIALDQQDVEPFVDTTKPSSSMFKDINDEFFYQVFGPFGIAPVKRPAEVKEPAASKKLKRQQIDESLLQTRIENGKITEYTVPQLITILRSKEIPELPALNGLRKADLVKLVYKHF